MAGQFGVTVSESGLAVSVEIPYSTSRNWLDNEIYAGVVAKSDAASEVVESNQAIVELHGNASILALDESLLDSQNYSVAVDVAASGGVSVELNAASAISDNTVTSDVTSEVAGAEMTIAGGDLSVIAESVPQHSAKTFALDIAGSGGEVAVSVGVAVSKATNTIDGDLSASIGRQEAGETSVSVGGSIDVRAELKQRTVNGQPQASAYANAPSIAAAVAIGIGGSGSGAGSAAESHSHLDVFAGIGHAVVRSDDRVTVFAHDETSLETDTSAISAAAGLGGLSVAVSKSLVVNQNDVSAVISESSVTSDLQDVVVNALGSSELTPHATTVAVTLAIGGSDTATNIDGIYRGDEECDDEDECGASVQAGIIEGSQVNAPLGGILVDAISDAEVTATVISGSVGLVAVDVVSQKVWASPAVTANIESSSLNAAKVIANSLANDTASTKMIGGDGGGLSINVANIYSEAKPLVRTEVGDNANIEGVTQVVVRAESISDAKALLGPEESDDRQTEINVGVVTVSASDSFATVAPTVDVTIGNASIDSGGVLEVDAVGGRLMERPKESVFDAASGVSANAGGLDANTIEFNEEHGLGYGDAIQYVSNGASNAYPVGGLTPGEIYRAIPRDATIIRLGSVLVTGSELSVYQSDTPITWSQAAELAEAAGGRLASLTSEAENNDVLSLLPEGQEAWIGGTDQAVNGTWVWEIPGSEGLVFWRDAQTVDAYSNWSDGKPDSTIEGMDFAAIENSNGRASGNWVAKTGEETLNYYVVASPSSDAVDLLKNELQFKNPHYLYGAQPNDGSEFGEDALAIAASGYWFDMPTMDELPAYIYTDATSGEFKFASSTGDTGWTFQAAVADAKNAGRVLAQPLTRTENDAIKQLMIDNEVTEAWLGGNDFNEEGTWVWNDTGDVFWQGGLYGEAVNGAFTNFASATQVIYDAGVIPIGGLGDGETYLVREIDLSENVLKLEHPDQLPVAPVDFDGAAITSDGDGVSIFNIAGHGFTDGQVVTYRAAKPLQFNALDVDADAETVTPHDENVTFDIDNPDQQAALLTAGQQVVYAANATNAQWYWLPNDYEETSDQPFWPQGTTSQHDPPYENWGHNAPNQIDTQFSAVMVDDGTWNNYLSTETIGGYILERPQFQVSPFATKGDRFSEAVDGWIGVWPATIISEDEWEAAKEAIGEENVYLGGSDADDRSHWYWTDLSPDEESGKEFWDGKSKGDEKNGYQSFWADGEPNDTGLINRETQLLMYASSGNWNDVSDDQTHPWLVESKQFTFIPFIGTYEEARADAAKQGGWLATIRSEEESAAALAVLEASSSGLQLWIGASDEQSEFDWMWVGDEASPAGTSLAPMQTELTYTNWYAGEPNNYNGSENYIQMYADPAYKGKWNDLNGDAVLQGYLLEKDDAFELINGSFTWQKAFEDAKSRGGQLAAIHDSSDQSLAESQLGGDSVWIGGTDQGHEGTFKWVEMSGYQNWAANQPDNYQNQEDYAHLRSDGTWNDLSATYELTGYLLEVDGEYSIVTGLFTWSEAKEDAEARGGHLAIIDSDDKQGKANEVARRFAWIGATANQLIDGLEAGEAYYVEAAGEGSYQLSSSLSGEPIAINGENKSSAVNHYLIPAEQQPIEGLREGQSYYVIAINEDSFRLAATFQDWDDETSITVSGSDTSDNGYSGTIGSGSTLGTEGVDLTDAGQGRHKLIVDLTETGSGDQSFAFVSEGWRPPFNLELNHGEAKAITSGGGGGFVGVGVPRALSVSEPDVGVVIETGARLQGETVYVNSRSHANADSYVDNTFVGILVESGNSLASIEATETSQVEVLGSIHADIDLNIKATNEDKLSAQAVTEGGGAIPLQNSWSRVNHQYTTEVLLDDFARLSAGNQIKIESHSSFDDEMVSKAKAGGVGGEMKANTAGDDDSKLVNDRKNLGVRIGTQDDRSTTSIDLASSYLSARSITLDAAVRDATASAYSEVRGAGLMTKKATATSRFYDDTYVTIGDNSVLHASDELVIGANHDNVDIHSHANFYRRGGSGWFSLRTQTWVDTQSRIHADEDVEILADSLKLDATHDDVDVRTRLTYGRVEYSDAYDFGSSEYTDIPADSSRNDSDSDSKVFKTRNEIEFDATVHFKDRRYLHVDDNGFVTNADGITLTGGAVAVGDQFQADSLILVDPINYQSSGSQFDALDYVVTAETTGVDGGDWSLSNSSSSVLKGAPTLASVSSVSVINDSVLPMEIQGIDLQPRVGNQAGLADSLTMIPDDGSIDTSQWAPGTDTDSGQSLGLFRLENTNPAGSDLIVSGDVDAGLGQIHLSTLGGDLLAGSGQTLDTHLTAAAIILDAPSGNVSGNPEGGAEPFTLEFLERPTYPDRVLRRDPDAYWRLGEQSGSVAGDQSGNDHSGIYGAGVELRQTGAIVGGNSAVRFTGGSDSFVQGADFTPTGLTGQTVSGWLMVESTDYDWQSVYFMGNAGDGPTDYTNGGENRENTFWVGRGGFLHWAVGLQGQAAQYSLTSDAGLVVPGRWYHFATVLDAENGGMTLMLNGRPIESSQDLPTDSKVRSESGNWVLANSPSTLSGYHGRLDEVAIINRALSIGEVQGLYFAFGPGADAQWMMNDASTVRMADLSGNQIDGRYFGVKNLVNTSPQGTGDAAYFDGASTTYAAVAATPTLNSEFAQTVEAWIQVESFTNEIQTVFVKNPAGAVSSGNSLKFTVDSSGTLMLSVPMQDGTSQLLNTDAGVIHLGQWHQVVSMVDAENQTISVVVDGAEVISANFIGADSSNTLLIPDGNWRFGNDFDGAAGLHGQMWNLTVRNEVMSSFSLAAQYSSIFARPNILQPREVRSGGNVDLKLRSLVNDDREESSSRFDLIEAGGSVDVTLLTPELIGEQSTSIGDYVYSIESIVTGGDLRIDSDDSGSLNDSVGLRLNFDLQDRPHSVLSLDVAGSINATDRRARLAGDDVLHATISSINGSVTLASAADVRIQDSITVGSGDSFTWGGTGQLLGDGNAATGDLIADVILLGNTGGLGRQDDLLKTETRFIGGVLSTGPIHVTNDSDVLSIGNLNVDRGDLEIVSSNQLVVTGEVNVVGGGDLTLAANGRSSTNLGQVTKQVFQRQVNFGYTNWSAGEPNNSGGDQNYLQMYTDGKWDDLWGGYSLGGYLLEIGGRYELVKGPFTWYEAALDSQSRGGQMASIQNADDQTRAQPLLQGFNIWLGGTDQGHEGTWKWVQREQYQNWALNQPDNYYGEEHYAHLRTDGTWNDLSGDSEIEGYLLEVDGVYTAITGDNSGTFAGNITWFDANQDAISRGGQLATIGSEQDQLRAQGIANGRQLWIGATDVQNPGTWLWLDSESLVIGAAVSASGGDGNILLSGQSGIVVHSDRTVIQYEQPFTLSRDQYSNWAGGEPNNFGSGEDYAMMYSDGTWNDASGDTELDGYIFELGYQFHFIPGSYTWHEASYDAQSRGGRLAVIDSEQDQLRAESHTNGTSVWIGATDRTIEGQWRWVVGDNYVNWGENQPDNYQGIENYGMIRPSGEWNDLSGDDLLPGYLFEIDGDFSVVNDRSYTWSEAFIDARERGGHLAVIVDAAAQLRAEEVIEGLGLNLWFGATDSQHEGYWKWIDLQGSDYETLISTTESGQIVLSSGSKYADGRLADGFARYSDTSGLPVQRAQVVDVTASSSLDSDPWSRDAIHAIDGSGLSDSGSHVISPDGYMWLSEGTLTGNDIDPFIQFDLGFVQRLDHLKVWNYNESLAGRPELLDRGIQSADVYVAGNDQVFELAISQQLFSKAPGNDFDDFSQLIDMGGVEARYIRFDNIVAFPGADSNLVGLSEIEFYVQETARESSIIMDVGSRIVSEQGDIKLAAPADVVISQISTSNHPITGGSVMIIADYDGILGSSPTYGGGIRPVGDATHVTASTAVLIAEGRSGVQSIGIGNGETPLLTEVGHLAAITNMGDIYIENIGDLEIGHIDLLSDVDRDHLPLLNSRLPQESIPREISLLEQEIDNGDYEHWHEHDQEDDHNHDDEDHEHEHEHEHDRGLLEIAGLGILDRGDVSRDSSILSVVTTGDLIVMPNTPVVNLSGGSIELFAKSDVTAEELFEVVSGAKDWETAYQDAVLRGGRLADLSSSEVIDAVKSIGVGQDLWIGLADVNATGNWAWLYPTADGLALQSPLDSNTAQWAAEPPTLGIGLTRATLDGDGLWTARSGDETYAYLLENPSPSQLRVHSPIFTSAGLGSVNLYEGSDELKISQPIPSGSGSAYLYVNDSGVIVEGQDFEVSLVDWLPPANVMASAGAGEGESRGIRYFYSTVEAERNNAEYADGVELPSASLNLPTEGLHTVYIRVLFEDGQSTDYQKLVEVAGRRLIDFGISQGPFTEGLPNQVQLAGEFSGGSLSDQHLVVIDWGDRSAPTILTLAELSDDFLASHDYPTGGRYQVTATVTGLLGNDYLTKNLWVQARGTNVVNDSLVVVGSSDSDYVLITQEKDEVVVLIAEIDGEGTAIDAAGLTNFTIQRHGINTFEWIDVDLGAGDDVLLVDMNTHHWVLSNGGDGRDHLTTRGNQSHLIGGAGDDTLVGGPKADILEGNGGSNVLSGRSGADQFFVDSVNNTINGGRHQDRVVWTGQPTILSYSDLVMADVEVIDLKQSESSDLIVSDEMMRAQSGDQTLQVDVVDWEQVIAEGDWRLARGDYWRGQYARIYTLGGSWSWSVSLFGGYGSYFSKPAIRTGDTLVVTGPPEYTNPVSPVDTNNDGLLTANDALLVINALARAGNGLVSGEQVDAVNAESSWYYLDVNADQQVTARDALQVINALGTEGESKRHSVGGQLSLQQPFTMWNQASENEIDETFELIANSFKQASFGDSLNHLAAYEEAAKDEIFSSTQRFDVEDVFDDGSSEFDWLL